jgi:hypothetical protein
VCAMGCVLCSSKSQFIQSFYRGSLIREAAKNAQPLGRRLRLLTHTVCGRERSFSLCVFSARAGSARRQTLNPPGSRCWRDFARPVYP